MDTEPPVNPKVLSAMLEPGVLSDMLEPARNRQLPKTGIAPNLTVHGRKEPS
jgi:hypothetical protein